MDKQAAQPVLGGRDAFDHDELFRWERRSRGFADP
jgi:hypothetical protein